MYNIIRNGIPGGQVREVLHVGIAYAFAGEAVVCYHNNLGCHWVPGPGGRARLFPPHNMFRCGSIFVLPGFRRHDIVFCHIWMPLDVNDQERVARVFRS